METKDFSNISLTDFKWLNEPKRWKASKESLQLFTDEKTDFWQQTYYNFAFNTGHLIGLEIKDNFTMEVCVEANFTTLYDQAGVMIYNDEKHWLKAGIEYNDGQPMIGSVLTNEISDWATATKMDPIESADIKKESCNPAQRSATSLTLPPPCSPLPNPPPTPPMLPVPSPLPTPPHATLTPHIAQIQRLSVQARNKSLETYLPSREKSFVEKEFDYKKKHACEIHELEKEVLKEKLREAKANAELAEYYLKAAKKGIFPGDPKKFYLRLTRLNDVVCVKYSLDDATWTLLRLCPFQGSSFAGLMACTPQRGGLEVTFSGLRVTSPAKDILHSN